MIEEETLPFYEPEQYYPVHISEVFKSRYQVLGKLGYGAYSTVWLCRDLRSIKDSWASYSGHQYVALKISTCLKRFPDSKYRELRFYEHLGELSVAHPGGSLVRDVYETFEISGPHASQCLVQPPMYRSIANMMRTYGESLSAPLLKVVLKCLLTALDFLHTEADVIHTDLTANNLMFSLEDKSMLERFEKDEEENPSPRKVIDEARSIYMSRSLPRPSNGRWGLPVLCDFGEARIGKIQETGPFVLPHIYRSPEIVFETPWGSPVDIGNVAALTWDLFEGKHLFHHLLDKDGHYDLFKHMAQIIGFIGLPPKDLVRRSETAEQYFNTEGKWVAEKHAKVPSVSFEEAETKLEGVEKTLFLQFIRSMLKWLPEERKLAKELLEDPWLDDTRE